MIDKARASGHNDHTSMAETIHTVSVDFIAASAQSVLRSLDCKRPADLAAHDWLRAPQMTYQMRTEAIQCQMPTFPFQWWQCTQLPTRGSSRFSGAWHLAWSLQLLHSTGFLC